MFNTQISDNLVWGSLHLLHLIRTVSKEKTFLEYTDQNFLGWELGQLFINLCVHHSSFTTRYFYTQTRSYSQRHYDSINQIFLLKHMIYVAQEYSIVQWLC